MTVDGLRVQAVGEERLDDVVEFVAEAQTHPECNVCFVGTDSGSLRDELTDVESWADRLFIAHDGDDLVGVLLADIDDEMRRVWWIGPWAADEGIAIELLSVARRRLGGLFDEEELAPDSRNESLRSVARRLGFVEDTPSSVLSKVDLTVDQVSSTERMASAESETVAGLHDATFAGTHTPGAKLVAAERTRIRTAKVDGATVAYIAYEVQADGTGYIDYLGVSPHARRRGLARRLVADVCRELGGEGLSAVHLTVRADAAGALDLYRSLGFVEERVIVPCRYGFTLG
ncbi:MAG: GNAT family N-acetyltransferase [Acidimicrobiia bacterium]|nr:GNAT family N-acetyltransferase [Acidimicrobiia bacterium]